MATWTKGELVRIVDEDDRDAAVEVLKALVSRGSVAIRWDDDTDPEAETEARRNRQLAEADAELGGDR